MSWDSYIDNLIARANTNIDRASIIGLQGGAKWTAHKSDTKVQPAEAAKIAQAFVSKDFSTFQANGLIFEGEKYQFLRQEDNKTMFAKKKDFGSVTLQCTKQAIVIGHTPEGKQQGAAAVAVGAIAEYLEGLGY